MLFFLIFFLIFLIFCFPQRRHRPPPSSSSFLLLLPRPPPSSLPACPPLHSSSSSSTPPPSPLETSMSRGGGYASLPGGVVHNNTDESMLLFHAPPPLIRARWGILTSVVAIVSLAVATALPLWWVSPFAHIGLWQVCLLPKLTGLRDEVCAKQDFRVIPSSVASVYKGMRGSAVLSMVFVVFVMLAFIALRFSERRSWRVRSSVSSIVFSTLATGFSATLVGLAVHQNTQFHDLPDNDSSKLGTSFYLAVSALVLSVGLIIRSVRMYGLVMAM